MGGLGGMPFAKKAVLQIKASFNWKKNAVLLKCSQISTARHVQKRTEVFSRLKTLLLDIRPRFHNYASIFVITEIIQPCRFVKTCYLDPTADNIKSRLVQKTIITVQSHIAHHHNLHDNNRKPQFSIWIHHEKSLQISIQVYSCMILRNASTMIYTTPITHIIWWT